MDKICSDVGKGLLRHLCLVLDSEVVDTLCRLVDSTICALILAPVALIWWLVVSLGPTFLFSLTA